VVTLSLCHVYVSLFSNNIETLMLRDDMQTHGYVSPYVVWLLNLIDCGEKITDFYVNWAVNFQWLVSIGYVATLKPTYAHIMIFAGLYWELVNFVGLLCVHSSFPTDNLYKPEFVAFWTNQTFLEIEKYVKCEGCLFARDNDISKGLFLTSAQAGGAPPLMFDPRTLSMPMFDNLDYLLGSTPGRIVFDAANVELKAFDALVGQGYEGRETIGDAIREQLQKTEFESLTGVISFDETGARTAVGVNQQIMNLQENILLNEDPVLCS